MNISWNRKAVQCAFTFSLLSFAISATFNANADINSKISRAVKDTKVDVSLRYRIESVDQDGLDEESLASTLKSRLTLTTGNFGKLSGVVETDNVSYIGNDSFNNTVNGKTDYAVVADPDGTELNQGYLKYSGELFNLSAGRQRINLDDQRFIGGVAWRQNEQTFDGYRLQFTPMSKVSLDASYIYNVNRIFGEDSVNSDYHGDIVLLNGKYKFTNKHSVTVYNYNLDFDNGETASSNTLGATYNGNFGIGGNNLAIKAGFASQKDSGDNPNSYDADYMVIDAMMKFKHFSVGGGYELLGSDNGIGFSTPLATLHKFQGFNDKFLNTPGTGIEDTYIKGATKIGPINVSAAYHMFSADEGSDDYGDEINIAAGYTFNKQISGLVKAANYSSDDFATDTTKIWFMITANY